jgi:hypothetical protein
LTFGNFQRSLFTLLVAFSFVINESKCSEQKDVIFGKISRLKSRNLYMFWRGTVLPQSAAFCGSPPRSTGALARPLLPESAALYWRSRALYCRKPPLSQ